MNILSVPLRTTLDASLEQRLQEAIQKDFFQSLSMFQADLSQVAALRLQARLLSNNGSSIDSDSVKLLQDYIKCLEVLQRKFSDDIAVFPWQNTLGYNPLGIYEYQSLLLEKINIVFQLAAVYLQLGIQESRYTTSGLKSACSFFQMAAGCFDSVVLLLDLTQGHPFDLDQNTVRALSYFMEAQAHESVWQKAILDNMKETIIAKLAQLVANTYEKAHNFAKNSNSLTLEYVNHAAVKQYHFSAVVHYRMASVSVSAFKYGDQVAHLREASKQVKNARRFVKYTNPSVVEDLSGLETTVESSLRSAERDNDLIYLQAVPLKAPVIASAKLVKPIPFEISDESDIFGDLIPYFVVQLAQNYREKLDEYVSLQIQKPIRALDKMYREFLSELNLPSAIDAIQKPESLPESVINHLQEIISNGGLSYFKSTFAELDSIRTKSREMLDGIVQSLETERHEDDMLRAQHGNLNWQRATSKEAASALRKKVEKMMEYLDHALRGDAVVRQNFSELEPVLDVYVGGKERLLRFIPDSNYTSLDKDLDVLIVDLRELIQRGDQDLLRRRSSILDLVLVKVASSNVLNFLVNLYKAHPHEEREFFGLLFEREFREEFLLLFNEDLRFIDELKLRQILLEEEIRSLNLRFQTRLKSVSSLPTSRQRALEELENAYSSYKDLISNLNEGLGFYNEFILKGDNAVRECKTFIQERRLEGCNMEAMLTQKIDHMMHNEDTRILRANTASPVPLVAPSGHRVWHPTLGIDLDSRDS